MKAYEELDLRREDKSNGWYVLYANTIDMYKRENPIAFGEAYNRNSSGFGQSKKSLDYMKDFKTNKFVRVYASRNKHRWVNDDDIIPMFSEYFI